MIELLVSNNLHNLGLIVERLVFQHHLNRPGETHQNLMLKITNKNNVTLTCMMLITRTI